MMLKDLNFWSSVKSTTNTKGQRCKKNILIEQKNKKRVYARVEYINPSEN